MKKIQILTTIMIIAIFIFIPKNTKAYNENNEINTDMILEEQQASFGIRDFLKEVENYSPDFVKDLDISDIFNSALTGKIDNTTILKKILNVLSTDHYIIAENQNIPKKNSYKYFTYSINT